MSITIVLITYNSYSHLINIIDKLDKTTCLIYDLGSLDLTLYLAEKHNIRALCAIPNMWENKNINFSLVRNTISSLIFTDYICFLYPGQYLESYDFTNYNLEKDVYYLKTLDGNIWPVLTKNNVLVSGYSGCIISDNYTYDILQVDIYPNGNNLLQLLSLDYQNKLLPAYKLAQYFLNLKQYNKILEIYVEEDNFYPYALAAAISLRKRQLVEELLEKIDYTQYDFLNSYMEYHKKHEIYDLELTKKKEIVCLYLSYSAFEDVIYGSELAAKNLAEQLAENYQVYIINYQNLNYNINKVNYCNDRYFEQLHLEIDYMIVSRYINYFIDFKFNTKHVYCWLHDVYLLPWHNGVSLPDYGKNVLIENLHKIERFIVLTPWHLEYASNFYPFIPKEKFTIIGNGINTKNFPSSIKKQTYKFIYTSCFKRGLFTLIEAFHIIHAKIPEAELHVFRDFTGHEEYVKSLKKYPYIHIYGRVSNERIISEMATTDIWLYPTTWEETYCISALEAQMSNILCIVNPLAALKDVVADRGILLHSLDPEEVAQQTLDVLHNTELIKELKEKGYNWALQQDWANIAQLWIDLFNNPQNWTFYPYKDINGYDMHHKSISNISEGLEEAKTLNFCKSFNTFGYFKNIFDPNLMGKYEYDTHCLKGLIVFNEYIYNN